MADILTPNLNYEYNGKTTLDVLVKPAVTAPDTLKLFRVIPDVRSKFQIGTSVPLNKILNSSDGSCGYGTPTDGVEINNVTLETAEIDLYMTQCANVFRDRIYEQALATGIDTNDMSKAPQLKKLMDSMIAAAIGRDAFNIFSFGDSGSGDTTINAFDGLWTKMIAGVATYCVTRATTPLSAGAMSADEALGALKEAYTEAPIILKQQDIAKRKFYVTGSVYENYQETLENKNATEAGWKQIQDGVQTLYYRGVEVVPIYAWDNFISAEGLSEPNRILYTTVENHVIGVEKASDVTKFDSWYSKDDNIQKWHGQFRMGYQYVHCDLQVVAY